MSGTVTGEKGACSGGVSGGGGVSFAASRLGAYDAVLFDMDGTLLDTERIAFDSWRVAGRMFGVPVTDEVIYGAVGKSHEAAVAYVTSCFPEALSGEGAEEFQAWRMAWKQRTLDEKGVPVKPGAVAALRALKRAGLKTALATMSTRERAEALLGRAGLLGMLDVLVCGDEVARGKPAPDAYLAAAQRVGTEPARCLVVEDSPIGVAAGVAAGMDVAMVPDLVPAGDAERGSVAALLSSLEGLPAWLGCAQDACSARERTQGEVAS